MDLDIIVIVVRGSFATQEFLVLDLVIMAKVVCLEEKGIEYFSESQ